MLRSTFVSAAIATPEVGEDRDCLPRRIAPDDRAVLRKSVQRQPSRPRGERGLLDPRLRWSGRFLSLALAFRGRGIGLGRTADEHVGVDLEQPGGRQILACLHVIDPADDEVAGAGVDVEEVRPRRHLAEATYLLAIDLG
jgi:hypothetical protein